MLSSDLYESFLKFKTKSGNGVYVNVHIIPTQNKLHIYLQVQHAADRETIYGDGEARDRTTLVQRGDVRLNE